MTALFSVLPMPTAIGLHILGRWRSSAGSITLVQHRPLLLKGLKERGLVAKQGNRNPLQCPIADWEAADHIVALNEVEHHPLSSSALPVGRI
jgi:hypothetical protein